MVIVDVLGGLGNQMFQYAIGRAMAERLCQPLKLDTTGFDNYQIHNGFELERTFVGNVQIASEKQIQEIIGWQAMPLVKKLVKNPRLSPFRSKQYIVEPYFQYWEGIKEAAGDLYLTGYWQSERYFQPIESIIRKDFSFKRPMSEINQEIVSSIQNSNSVSLHVRRGDYVSNISNLAIHGVCSLEYYNKAIKYISEHIEQPRFYIFSDDIQWVKENLNIDSPRQYINHNQGDDSYNDMWLMSLCKHNIIANSSFSWWGAWLNMNSHKIVIAPKKWFADSSVNTLDLIPPSWTQL